MQPVSCMEQRKSKCERFGSMIGKRIMENLWSNLRINIWSADRETNVTI